MKEISLVILMSSTFIFGYSVLGQKTTENDLKNPISVLPFSINEHKHENITILDLSGNVNQEADIYIFSSYIDKVLKQSEKDLLINFYGVQSINSAIIDKFLDSLVLSFTKVNREGGRLKIFGFPHRISDLLFITKVITVFDIFDGEGDAISSLTDISLNEEIEKKLIAREKQAWEAFIKNDKKFFKTFLASDAEVIGKFGILTKAESISGIKIIKTRPCILNSYSFNNFKVKMLNNYIILATYEATQKGTCNGQKIPSKVYESSLYVKETDSWVITFHQETIVPQLK